MKRKTKRVTSSLRKKLVKLGSWILILGLLGIVALLGVFIYFAKDLPSPEAVAKRAIAQSTKIYDRTGTNLLYDLHGEEKRTLININDLPAYVIDATLAAEDDDFYNHFGVDFKSIARAAWSNLKNRRVSQGGSTITQQLIKNSILSPERTFTRKIKEVLLAIELEFRYSKNEILQMYFNQIAYGSNAYGIEAAANTYFNKPAKDLNLAESAIIAALPKAPTYYSPYGPNKELLLKRKDNILGRMNELGFIELDEVKKTQEEEIKFTKNIQIIKAPHFIFYIQEYLNNKYDENFVSRAGWKVTTSLDFELQQEAEKIIEEGAKNNDAVFGAANASLVSLDPKTGQILAMVGSRNYFENSLPIGCNPGLNCKFEPNVNVAIRSRSPGSAFKPFAYATAFKKGFSDKTVIYDAFTEFNPACNPDGTPPSNRVGEENFCYHPRNYDGNFRGLVSFREGLAQSLNVPSAKVLYLAGIENTILTAEDFGISTLKDRSRFGLSLVLGGGEVKLLELASAYGAFAQEGILHKISPVLKIEDNQGNIIEEFNDESKRVLDLQISRLITDILSDNNARSPVFGLNNSLFIPDRPAAAKTGTTQDFKDAWVVGYTPSLVTGVWVGNNDNRPMTQEGSGVAAAAPLWRQFMEKANQDKLVEEFIKPDFVEPPKKPLLGGITSNPLIPDELNHTILFYVDKSNPLGPVGNPNLEPQFKNWELGVQGWLLGNFNNQIKPQDKKLDILISSPLPLQQLTGDFLEIKTLTTGVYQIKQVDFFLDNLPIGSDGIFPYELIYRFPNYITSGGHKIKARVYDQRSNQNETEVDIFINRPVF